MTNPLDAVLGDSEPVAVSEAEAPAAASPAPAEAAPAPEAAQPRAPDGKFAPKAGAEGAPAQATPPAASAAPAPAAPVPAAPTPDPTTVPIGAMLDERDQRKALQKRIDEFEAAEAKRKAEAEAAAATPRPAFEDDPRGHLASRDDEIQAMIYAQRALIQQEFAEEKYGAERVKEVVGWAFERAQRDPVFNQQALSSRNPIEFAIKAHQEDQLLSQIRETGLTSDELAQFRAWQSAQAGAAAVTDPSAQAAPAAVPAIASPKPPVSLASQPSAGGPASVPSGPGRAFAETFGGG